MARVKYYPMEYMNIDIILILIDIILRNTLESKVIKSNKNINSSTRLLVWLKF